MYDLRVNTWRSAELQNTEYESQPLDREVTAAEMNNTISQSSSAVRWPTEIIDLISVDFFCTRLKEENAYDTATWEILKQIERFDRTCTLCGTQATRAAPGSARSSPWPVCAALSHPRCSS